MVVPDEVGVTGLLMVLPHEPEPGLHPEPEVLDESLDVRLVTDDGTSVALEGHDLAGVRSGDTFSGVVAVDDEVADELDGTVAPRGVDLGELVAETSVGLALPLRVLSADVEPATEAAISARAHTVDVMYLSTSSSGRPAASAFTAPVSRLSEFWSSQTNGQVSKISRPYAVRFATVSKSVACSPEAAWRYAAGPSGFNRKGPLSNDASSYYWAETRTAHLVVIVPGALCGSGSGLGTIGAVGSGGTTWSSVPADPLRWDGVLFHEIGHNLGLGHSNLQSCSYPRVDASPSSSTCGEAVYYDFYDVMGGGYSYGSHTNDHHIAALNVTHKASFDALPRSASLRRITTSGGNQQTLTIQAASATTGLRGLEIVDPVTSRRLYVEYRSGTGRDASSFYTKLTADASMGDPTYSPGVRILKLGCTAGTAACAGASSAVLRNWTSPTTARLSFAAGDDFLSYSTNTAGSASVRVSVLSTTSTAAKVLVSFDSRLPVLAKPGLTITGTPKYYRTLTATPSKPWPTGTTVRYAWLRDGSPIPGATASTYRVTSADVGAALTVRAVGSAPGYARAVATSPAVRVLSGWDPVSVSGTVTFPAGISAWDRAGVEVRAVAAGDQPPGAPSGFSAAVNATTGAYTMAGVAPGKWRFVAVPGPADSSTGLTRQRDVTARWHGGASTEAAATVVTVDAARTGIGIAMARSLRISGTVSLPAGSPASWMNAVHVWAEATGGTYPWPRSADVRPAADGTYVVSGLDPASYRLRFSVDEYDVPLTAEYFDGAYDSARATLLALTGDRTGVNVSLDRMRRISGTVTGAEPRAYEYLQVSARDTSGSTVWADVAADGSFTLDRLMPTSATLCMTVYSWAPADVRLAPVCLGGGRDHPRSGSIDLRAGDATGVTLAAAPARRVAGAVILPAGMSSDLLEMTSVQAHALSPAGEIDSAIPAQWGQVAAGGTYEIDGLTPGRYALEFTPPAYRWDPDTATSVPTDLPSLWLGATQALTPAATVDVRSGDAGGRDIRLVRANAVLSGTVNTAALPGSYGSGTVTIVDAAGREVTDTWLSDGAFRATGLIPGSYRVLLSTSVTAGSTWADSVQYLRTSTGAWLHTVAAASERRVTLAAKATTAQLRGTVRAAGFPGGTTAPLAAARLYERDGTAWIAYPETLGTRSGNGYSAFASPRLAAGVYTVAWSALPDAGAATGEWWERTSSASAQAVTLAAGVTRVGIHGSVRAAGFTTVDPQVAAATPTIVGVPRVGTKLSVATGTWTAGTTFLYRWTVGGSAVSTAATFTPRAVDRGKAIAVTITGSAAAYRSVARTSATATVGAGVLTAPVPKITGTAKVGLTLKAVPGTWTAGTTLTYRWRVAGKAVAGATKATFIPRAADRGKTVTVAVTGAKAGYTTITRISKATAKVAAASKMKAATPKITGTAAVGRTLKVSRGTWTSGVTFTCRWYASGKAISGATKSSLTLRAAQRGKTITVRVTGKKPGYVTTTKTSKATSRVR